ncbi:two pore domain potassium channel family protein [Ruegeria pomeroyi]|nr:two pore domain potassium channel family protein [Ruegeria pomeroyi]MCE8534632.1 two pore domain potassium channel family protein [Ruegeria pomeroyi]
MPVIAQILFGSALLLACSAIHIKLITMLIARLKRVALKRGSYLQRHEFYRTSFVFLALLASHTVQIYVWAVALWALNVLDGFETPIYFSLVTYTTLGYGDVTLAESWRVFGAMASATGILAFGLSTAVLVGYFAHIWDEQDK